MILDLVGLLYINPNEYQLRLNEYKHIPNKFIKSVFTKFCIKKIIESRSLNRLFWWQTICQYNLLRCQLLYNIHIKIIDKENWKIYNRWIKIVG